MADAQNRGFWIQWGEPQKYQVFDSPSAAISELRFHRANGTFAKVGCAGLQVTEDAGTNTVKAVVPRSCLPKAPNRVRFKGIATQGLSLSDQTQALTLGEPRLRSTGRSGCYQPRSRHSARCGRSAPIVESSPCPG